MDPTVRVMRLQTVGFKHRIADCRFALGGKAVYA